MNPIEKQYRDLDLAIQKIADENFVGKQHMCATLMEQPIELHDKVAALLNQQVQLLPKLYRLGLLKPVS